MTDIYVDGDACPVRDEVYRVAARLQLKVFVVSNGSRPVRPPGTSNVRMVLVGDRADAADDWIAEHISAVDVCVTSDIPLASRCLKKGARVVSPTGKQFTQANIGNALVGREIARHLRELGTNTRGPAPLTKSDRSLFLSALDTAVQGALREAARSYRRECKGKLNGKVGASISGASGLHEVAVLLPADVDARPSLGRRDGPDHDP